MTYPKSREPTLAQHGRLEDEFLALELSLSLPVLCVCSGTVRSGQPQRRIQSGLRHYHLQGTCTLCQVTCSRWEVELSVSTLPPANPAPSTQLLCGSGWVLKMLGIQEFPCALTLISLSPGDWNPQSRSRNRG